MISAEIRALIEQFPLGFVATCQPGGTPAVSPKGTFLVLDDRRIAFAHIRSPGTLRGIAHQPAVEVNFIDVFRRKGARLAGKAEVVARGDAGFGTLEPRFAATWPDLAPRIKALVVIGVERASVMRTPPYDDGATEAEMIALYKARFAEMFP